MQNKIQKLMVSKMNFKETYSKKIEFIDNYIGEYLDSLTGIESKLHDALKYAVLGGGKRLRSILCTEICTMLGGDINDALPYATAIELIHAYSLVHDDLPSMDNADMRRGMPSCHKKYGEGFAVLTGDGLLNLAFETMTKACLKNNDLLSVQAMDAVGRASGIFGMVNGQAVDLKLASKKDATEADLIGLIEQKTMALIKAAIISGAIMSGCSEETLAELDKNAYHLGLAFQIRDDFEDEIQDEDESDSPNFINILGREQAQEKLSYHSRIAYDIISKYGEDSFLCEFHKFLFD